MQFVLQEVVYGVVEQVLPLDTLFGVHNDHLTDYVLDHWGNAVYVFGDYQWLVFYVGD